MDIQYTSTKRSLPESMDQNSSNHSQSDNIKNNPKKMKKKAKSSDHHTSPSNSGESDLSSSDSETVETNTPLENKKNNNEIQIPNHQTDSLLENLLPAASIFEDADQNNFFSFQYFLEFMIQCDKTKSASTVLQEYTKDIPAFIKLIDQCHSCIKNRKLKNRLTRIRNSLCPPKGEKVAKK